ncbi:MAG: efflux RND transporter periplasmic adaptor subunit [Nitrospirota bacterium]
MKKTIAFAVAILLVIGAVIIIKNKKSAIAHTPTVASYPLPVEAAEAKEGSITISSHYIGTILPLRYADVSPRITGNILSVYVREGDVIHKGQLLVTLDDRTLREKESAQALEIPATEAQLAGANSGYETQQAIYERDEMLHREGAIALEALQKSRAQRDLSYAQVKSLEEKIKALKNAYKAASVETSYARLYSPIDGVVTRRLQEPGDLAVPGKAVLKVECTSDFKVAVQLPQAEMSSIKKGGAVILSDGRNKSEAAISRVYPAVTTGTLGTVEIAVPKRPFDIHSGGTVGVDVITGKTDTGIIVPLNALLESQRGCFVYKVNGNKITVSKVQVLGKNGEYATIQGALKNGDIVVTGDEGKLLRLSDGMSVAVVFRENTDSGGGRR